MFSKLAKLFSFKGLSMKQVMVRVGALVVVVSLGVIAIAQAQRGEEGGEDLLGGPSAEGNTLRGEAPLPDEPTGVNPLRESFPSSDDQARVLLAGDSSSEQRGGLAPADLGSAAELPGADDTRSGDPFNHRGAAANPLRSEVPGDESAGYQMASADGVSRYARPPREQPYGHAVQPVGHEQPLELADASGAVGSGFDSGPGPMAPAEFDGRDQVPITEGMRVGGPDEDRSADSRYDVAPGRFQQDAATGAVPYGGNGQPAMQFPPARGGSGSDSFARGDRAGESFASAGSASAMPRRLGPPPGSFPQGDFPSAPPPDAQSSSSAGTEGTGRPGSESLEGPQAPRVVIEKRPPESMQVGSPAAFTVLVRNDGSVAASNVEIRDQVPQGTRLMNTTPRASRGAAGELVWSLGTLKPGDETTVQMQVMPLEEGRIGSVASVHFAASASAKVRATKPELVVESSAPSQVLIGQPLQLTINVSNPGSGTARDVVLAERVPPGMRHVAGSDLEYEIGTLKPGESRKLELEMVADRPGQVNNVLVARGAGNLQGEHRLQWEVIAPALEVNVDGSRRRFLEREAVYEVAVSNPGTAPAKQVALVAQLPPGLEFVSANNAGHYDKANHAVQWRLEELPVRETGRVELVALPVQSGDHQIEVRGSAAGGFEAEQKHPVRIEGIAAIMFEVRDVTDPIEVGGETMYEIRVLNQGSKESTNVRLAVDIPPEMEAVAAEGPTRHAIHGRQVIFEGLARLAPKADTTYRVRVRGAQPADLRVRVQLLTDEMRGVPVTKEESTRVYSDQ